LIPWRLPAQVNRGFQGTDGEGTDLVRGGELNLMNVQLNPVELSDVSQIVGLHVQTFGAARHLGVLFGPEYMTRMYMAAVRDQNFIFVKACRDSRLIGFSSARLEGYHSLGLASIDLRAVRNFLWNARMVLTPTMMRRIIGRQFSERRLRKLRKTPYAQAYITCVTEQSRGSGVGSLLRNRIYEECRHRGAAFIYTGILMDNAPMLAISARDGFREVFRDRIGSVVYLEKTL
jgi:GNAT superfamily N-acetyltransferase